MPSIYVKPRPSNPKQPNAGVLQVRRENGKPIPAGGAHVELTPYIRRRLRDGDLVRTNAPKPQAPAKTGGAKTIAKTSDQED
ncbi:DUF2635 domain-containing protein [Chromohalobacter israelensis]|uniref:DUF2635 domain-containing protein n=1 Tax=Chromohalobacter israelensis TaxID=141390 RepID=UPI00102709F4|nr:DUF2635 domain-containing protein [Chromohalobacter salexigens]RXE49213.1 hypothetical protein B4O83_15050 [Chromohalobacter salexigens]